jgi:hypothetical protein
MPEIPRVDNDEMRALLDKLADRRENDRLHGSLACEPGKVPEDYPPPRPIVVSREPIAFDGELAIYYWFDQETWEARHSL